MTQGLGRFARHYLEMVLAMFAGMVPYGILFVSPLDPVGQRELLRAHPYVSEILMLTAMSLPMAGYMLYRGHGMERTGEMVAGMAVPSLAVIWLTAAGAVPGLSVERLSLWSHVAMLLGMLGAMLFRWDEYAGEHHHGAHAGHGEHAGHADHEGHGAHERGGR